MVIVADVAPFGTRAESQRERHVGSAVHGPLDSSTQTSASAALGVVQETWASSVGMGGKGAEPSPWLERSAGNGSGSARVWVRVASQCSCGCFRTVTSRTSQSSGKS